MNTVVKRKPVQKLFRTWVDWLVAVILSFFFAVMTLAYYNYKTVLYFIVIAHLMFYFGMMYSSGQRTAKYDRLKISGVTDFSVKWALLLAFFANIIPIFTTLVQLILQLCRIKSFLPIYKLINIYFMPLVHLMNPDSATGTLSSVTYIVLFALCFVSMLIVYITYSLVYKDVDIKALMIYDRKE